jgi:hypothetical protein
VVCLERLGLPTGAVKSKHRLAAKMLTERLLGDQRLELAYQLSVAAAFEVGVDPLFEDREPELFQTSDLTLRERLEGEVRQRRTAPEPERRSQSASPGLTGEHPSLPDQALEAAEISLVGRGVEHVAGSLGLHAIGAERLPEVRDHVLERGPRRLRRVLAPQLVQ